MNKAEAADFHIYMKKDCWEQQYLFDQTLTLSPQNVVSQVHRALHAVRLDFIWSIGKATFLVIYNNIK